MRAMSSFCTFCPRRWSLADRTVRRCARRRDHNIRRLGNGGCSRWGATISWRLESGYSHCIPERLPACVSCSRRFGQNERSAFGFLQSSEPFGYQDFAYRTVYDSEHWYRIDNVYDYLASQGGFRFQSKDRERRWEISQDAVVACADMPGQALKVLKAVSLVAVLEPVPGLSAEVDTLAWMLGCTLGEADSALVALEKRGVVHKRESLGDWSLWSHSSVDLEHWMEKAKGAIPELRRLDDELCRITPLRPIVAQRHYQRTGTLRSFAVLVGKEVGETASGTDGVVLVRPVYPDEDPEQARREGAEISKRLGSLAVVRMQPITCGGN